MTPSKPYPWETARWKAGAQGRNAGSRQPTAVSTILRRLDRSADSVPSLWPVEGRDGHGYRIRVASDRKSRERAYRLAQKVYEESAYAAGGPEAVSVHDYDALPETFTLLVEDESGAAVATVTLVFDGDRGLPCDEIYAEELRELRQQGRRLVEVTRLAISSENRNNIDLLLSMFNFIYIFARRVRNHSDFVIEVNPRHVKYYRRLLRFQIVGPERPCPRVQGAPAVLMGLDMARAEEEIQHARRDAPRPRKAPKKNLFAHAMGPREEYSVARFLSLRHLPMSPEEKQYFNVGTSA